jgi:Flp pilus assembly protein TadD
MAAGDYQNAVSYLHKAAALEPENASNYFKLFKAHQRKRNYMDALQDISTAVKWAIPKVSFKDLLIQVGHCDQTLLNTSC